MTRTRQTQQGNSAVKLERLQWIWKHHCLFGNLRFRYWNTMDYSNMPWFLKLINYEFSIMQFPSWLKCFVVNIEFPKLETCFQGNVCFQINNHVSKFIVFSTFSSKFFFFKLIFEIFVQFLLWFHLLWTNSTKNVAKNLFENSIPLPIFFRIFQPVFHPQQASSASSASQRIIFLGFWQWSASSICG